LFTFQRFYWLLEGVYFHFYHKFGRRNLIWKNPPTTLNLFFGWKKKKTSFSKSKTIESQEFDPLVAKKIFSREKISLWTFLKLQAIWNYHCKHKKLSYDCLMSSTKFFMFTIFLFLVVKGKNLISKKTRTKNFHLAKVFGPVYVVSCCLMKIP
jgi:hypothetical protein